MTDAQLEELINVKKRKREEADGAKTKKRKAVCRSGAEIQLSERLLGVQQVENCWNENSMSGKRAVLRGCACGYQSRGTTPRANDPTSAFFWRCRDTRPQEQFAARYTVVI